MSRRYYSGGQRSSEPLRGRKLWRYGDWGSASEHLGRHWEQVGAPILADALNTERAALVPADPTYTPRVMLTIVADNELAAEVHQAGLAHADSMLLGLDSAGHVVVEPVDFKWSLETATPRQVSGYGLARLLNAGLPRLELLFADALARLAELENQPASGELISGHIAMPAYVPVLVAQAAQENADPEQEIVEDDRPYAVITRDGVFFAPHNQANIRYMKGENGGGNYGVLAADQVWFQEVDGIEFFSPLPGWETGVKLAEYDKSSGTLGTPDGAERYYRLGAGTAGALTRWHTSIFSDTPANINVLDELEQLRKRQRLPSSNDIAMHMERMMNVRSEREAALNEWLREIYGWGRFKGDLGRYGIKATELDTKGGKRRWGAVFGAIQKSIATLIRGEGMKLITEQDMSDMDALEALQHRAADFYDFGQASSRKLIEAEVGQRRPKT